MSRFSFIYSLLYCMPGCLDRDELKDSLCLQFSYNRTTHLSALTPDELRALTAYLRDASGHNNRLRRERGHCLRLMRDLGVNTASREAVDRFCLDSRIAGHLFAHLSLQELKALRARLYAIKQKANVKQYDLDVTRRLDVAQALSDI